jgi:hypothetical protein
LLAWVHKEVCVHSPYLLATSAEANSGKSTLAGLLVFLIPRGLSTVGITEAALFRGIELWDPSLVIDEADTVLVENEALRAVINSGWTRGSGVVRCIGDHNEPHLFSTFCPKVIAMKGRRLPDTTLSRCVIIELKRRKPGERVKRLVHIDDDELGDLRRQAMRWAADHVEVLKAATPEMPAGFDNRLGDNWQVQFAIADLVGCGDEARQAAARISKVVDAGDTSVGVRLLADIKAIFEERATDKKLREPGNLPSAVAVTILGAMEDRPWSEWGKSGTPITPSALARLLRPFQVYPGTVRTGPAPDETTKGYQLTHFKDAFERYLVDLPKVSEGELGF